MKATIRSRQVKVGKQFAVWFAIELDTHKESVEKFCYSLEF